MRLASSVRECRALKQLALLLLLLLAAGCGNRAGVPVPKVPSAEEMARLALKEYDTNGDGYLDAKELERCPALKNALKSWDKDGDGRVSSSELVEGLKKYEKSQTGITSLGCRVWLDGQPLEGATVTFVPEKFFGPNIKPASGVSGPDGRVILRIEGEELPGIHRAIFRIEVSKKVGGQETIPARFNTETVLGHDMLAEVPGKKAVTVPLQLTSK